MQVVFVSKETVAKNVQTFWFEPPKTIDYIAGQFIEMTLPHDNADERGQKHWFTLSSSPTEALISITTKFTPEHSSTFKNILYDLEPGASVTISEPMGDFVLPKDPTIPLIFVVGGLGITPVRSIIKWLLDTKEQRLVHIIYGVRSLDDLAFQELFAQYGAITNIILSEPPAHWHGLTGHVSCDRIMELLGQDKRTLVYISGPEQMVEKLETELKATGVSPDKLVLDFFTGYQNV